MATNKEPKVPVGLRTETNQPVLISELKEGENGLACNCICPNPDCGAKLIARFYKGETVNHFAHHGQAATTKCSSYGLHLAGETILMRQETLTLPRTQITQSGSTIDQFGLPIEVPEYTAFNEHTKVKIAELVREASIASKEHNILIRCDVSGNATYEDLTFPLNLEVKVTHEVGDTKLAKLEKLDLTTIEIDISHLHGSPWTLKDVEVAVLSPKCMTLINSSSALTKKLQSKARDWRNEVINATKRTRQQQFDSLAESLVSKKLPLPAYPVSRKGPDYWQYFCKKYESGVFKCFNVFKYPIVKEFRHIEDNLFEFLFESDHRLCAFVAPTRRQQTEELDSYLVFDGEVITQDFSLSQALKWGKNKKKANKEAYLRAHARDEWNKRQKYLKEVNESLLNERPFYRNALRVAFEESRRAKLDLFHRFNFDKETFESLSYYDYHEYPIFNVPNTCWQPLCIDHLLRNGSRPYGEVLRYLKKIGVFFSQSYKTKHHILDLPDPFKVFSGFMTESKRSLSVYLS